MISVFCVVCGVDAVVQPNTGLPYTLPNRDMKNPYATHILFPYSHRWEMADVSVSGLPMIDTEKSEQTRLNRMMFIGVHS